MFQDHGAMKVSADVSSPRIVTPGAQGRPSGRKHRPPSSSVSSSFSFSVSSSVSSVSFSVSSVSSVSSSSLPSSLSYCSYCLLFLLFIVFSLSLQWAVSFRLVLPPASSSLTCQTLLVLLLLFFLPLCLGRLLLRSNPPGHHTGRGRAPRPSCCPLELQSRPSGRSACGGWAAPSPSKSPSLVGRSVLRLSSNFYHSN